MASMAAFYYDCALSLAASGHLSRAEELLTQAALLEANNPLHHNALGLCRFALGRFEAARSSWLLGAGLTQGNDAAAFYLRTMDEAPFRAYIRRYNSCLERAKRGRFLSALVAILPALEALPNAEGYNLAGLLFYRLGMRKNARAFWWKTLELDKTNKDALRYLAHAGVGWIPYPLERALWGVLLLAGRLKLL